MSVQRQASHTFQFRLAHLLAIMQAISQLSWLSDDLKVKYVGQSGDKCVLLFWWRKHTPELALFLPVHWVANPLDHEFAVGQNRALGILVFHIGQMPTSRQKEQREEAGWRGAWCSPSQRCCHCGRCLENFSVWKESPKYQTGRRKVCRTTLPLWVPTALSEPELTEIGVTFALHFVKNTNGPKNKSPQRHFWES